MSNLLMSEWGDKVFGDRAANRIDFDLVENLKATLKDTNVDFGPDVVAAAEFLCAAVIPAHRVPKVVKEAGANFLQRIATRLKVPVTRMYAGMQRRSQWQAQIDMGSKPHWLYSSEPPPSNLQAVRPAERTICGVKQQWNCACVGLYTAMVNINKNDAKKTCMEVKFDGTRNSIFEISKKYSSKPPPKPRIPEKPSPRAIRKGIPNPPPSKHQFFRNWPTLLSRMGAR